VGEGRTRCINWIGKLARDRKSGETGIIVDHYMEDGMRAGFDVKFSERQLLKIYGYRLAESIMKSGVVGRSADQVEVLG
jgi:hypothetical protein